MTRRTEIKDRPVKSTPKKFHAVKVQKAKPQAEPIPAASKVFVSTSEIVNVLADTFERLYEEFGQDLNRPSAEDYGLRVAKYLRHGITGEGGMDTAPRLRDKSMTAPLCKACKG